MAELPRHPDTGEVGDGPSPEPTPTPGWIGYVIGVVVVVALLVVIVLHLTGVVGPGVH
jgi:hypothetical protein